MFSTKQTELAPGFRRPLCLATPVPRARRAPSAARRTFQLQIPKGVLRVRPGCSRSSRRNGATDGAAEDRNVTSSTAEADDRTRRFVESLSREERMLVVLKRELYDGSWQDMVSDLRARLEGRPYIFKLAHRIVDDLSRIDRLQDFERQNNVDLGDYIELES